MQALKYVSLTLVLVTGVWAEEDEISIPGEQDTRIFSTNPALATNNQVVGVSSAHGALLHVSPAQGLVSIVNQGQRYPEHGHPGPGGHSSEQGIHFPEHGHPGHGGHSPGHGHSGPGIHYPEHGHPGHGGHYPGHGHPGHGGHYPGHGHPGHGGHYPGHGHPGHGGHYPGHGHPGHGGHYPGHGHPGHDGHYPGHGHPGHGGHYPGHIHPGQGGSYPGHGGSYPGHGSPCQDHSPSKPVVSCKYFCKNPCGELYCCDDSNNPYTTTQKPTIRPGKCPPPRIVCHDSLRLKPPTQCAHDGYCKNYNEKCCWDACLKFSTCKLAENYYGK